MRFSIICPYCFNSKNSGAPFSDDDVLFRSEVVNHGEPDFLPDDYDGIEDFIARYRGADKEEILKKYADWAFFAEGIDPAYEEFWAKFGGTTESNPADSLLKVKAYQRKIINPKDPSHQKYLRKQNNGEYFIRDAQGMVSQIELVTRDRCSRRVCPFCRNPLPENYGKNPVKFVPVIGIVGAGKTVYLSQLLKRMRTYASNVGLTAIVTNASVRTFLENNVVAEKKPLPVPTQMERLQQPLFYEMIKDAKDNGRITETFVLYDVAGEVFKEEDASLVRNFAPFIEHADGAVVLIDPLQFEIISGSTHNVQQLDDPAKALYTIQNIVTHGNASEKCKIPFAVCISKADMKEVQDVLNEDLREMLLEDVTGVENSDGFCEPVFNAEKYAPIGKELIRFFKKNERPLAQMLQTNYSTYAYFAFTALGCDVEKDKTGKKYPVGPILPKRVEEPLLWLFYKLGYITRNANLPGEIYCPRCGSENNYELPKDDREVVEWHGLRRRRISVNRGCKDCLNKWEYMPED